MFRRAYTRPLLLLVGIALCTPSPAKAQSQGEVLGRAIQNRWILSSILNGHIVVRSSMVNGRVKTGGLNPWRPESLSLQCEGNQCLFDYSRKTADELLTIQCVKDNTITLRRTPRGKSTQLPVELLQKPGQGIVFSIGSGEKLRKQQSENVWLLLLELRPADRETAISLLELLRPDWKLAESLANIEARLLDLTGGEAIQRQSHLAALVAQLGDARFSKREAADRELRAHGAVAANFLRQLPFKNLDAEQQYRIIRILEASSEQDEDDSVEEAAILLAAKPQTWQALASRPEKTIQARAIEQLQILLGR